MLVVTTTHMKYGYHRRNGVPASIKSKMTEYFIRHGPELTIAQFTEDPPYLEETLVRTTDFQWNPNQNVGAPGQRLRDRRGGHVVGKRVTCRPIPSGQQHHEFADTLGIPFEATRGHKEAMYPEYLPKLRKLMRRCPPAPHRRQPSDAEAFPGGNETWLDSVVLCMWPRSWPAAAIATALALQVVCRVRNRPGKLAGSARPAPAAASNADVGILHVQGKVYMVNLGDVNITAQVGDDGILLVDSGPADMSEKLIAALRQRFEGKRIRQLINTHAHLDHTGGNAAVVAAAGGGAAGGRGGGGGGGGGGGALRIIAHENTFNRMSGVVEGDKERAARRAAHLELLLGEEGNPLQRRADRDSLSAGGAHRRRRDGLLPRLGRHQRGWRLRDRPYPEIDAQRGGSIQGTLDALNRILDITIPKFNEQGGTRSSRSMAGSATSPTWTTIATG